MIYKLINKGILIDWAFDKESLVEKLLEFGGEIVEADESVIKLTGA